MNSEEKIYSKIKNASHKGEKDFPGMDKVWNRVEEKLDNTLVVKKKNTWQKLAIAATVLLSFSIIYQFIGNEQTFKGKIKNNEANPIIVSTDSVKKIIDKAKEVVVEHTPTNKAGTLTKPTELRLNSVNKKFAPMPSPTTTLIEDSAYKTELKSDFITLEDKETLAPEMNNNFNLNTENKVSFNNSVLNSSNGTNGYLAPGKKYEVVVTPIKSKYKAAKSKTVAAPVEKNKDLVVIDGVAMDKKYDSEKELNKISTEEIENITYLPNPLYIINGVEYSEASLFGKNPTSPYAPLDKQKITSTNILKPADATKIYGQKGVNGIVIITTKDGKPAKK